MSVLWMEFSVTSRRTDRNSFHCHPLSSSYAKDMDLPLSVGCDKVNSFSSADDMSTPNAKEGLQAVGVNSILPKEHNGQFVNLPIVKYFTEVDNVSETFL